MDDEQCETQKTFVSWMSRCVASGPDSGGGYVFLARFSCDFGDAWNGLDLDLEKQKVRSEINAIPRLEV